MHSLQQSLLFCMLRRQEGARVIVVAALGGKVLYWYPSHRHINFLEELPLVNSILYTISIIKYSITLELLLQHTYSANHSLLSCLIKTTPPLHWRIG